MQRTALTIGVLALALLVNPPPVEAYYEGPWCAYMKAGRDFITSRCDLRTYEACRAEIFATPGAWCTENPYYRVAEQPKRRKAKRTYR